MAIEQEARRRAEYLVRDTEDRAREAADEILGDARQWFADALEAANETQLDQPVIPSDSNASDVLIDLRPDTRVAVSVDDVLGPTFDQVDLKVQDAVARAVRRAFQAPKTVAGRYRD